MTHPNPENNAHQWNVNDIYPNWQAWTEDKKALEAPMERLRSFQGRLMDSPETLLEAYKTQDEIMMTLMKLYRYPQLQFDTNQKNNDLRAKMQEIAVIFAQLKTIYAWIAPEILESDEAKVMGWFDQHPDLAVYRYPISEVFRQKAHTLDAQGEELLSYGARFNESPSDIYSALSTADVEFNTIEIQGKSQRITYGAYRRLLEEAKSQQDRQRTFEAMYDLYTSKRNTYAAIYQGVCEKDWANAQAREFDSCAQAALFEDHVPVSVLETLIQTAKEGATTLQRYHRMRAKVLGLENNYHLYDTNVPLVENKKTYAFDDVIDLIIDAVEPLGKDYQSKMRTAISSRWIDVYEQEGKRAGAYSAGVYGVHPYMLLNYNDTLDAVFTLAHELGHTLHTVYSNETQPFATSQYTIFVAEVASTTTEGLLLRHLMKHATDDQERLQLLTMHAGNIVGTFYTQCLFANFELEAHRLVERGEPFTADSLDALYTRIAKDFYGDAIVWDDAYATTWARIPHFYRSPFYVYQYATCYASSAKLLSEMHPDSSNNATQRYLKLLTRGGDAFPMSQLLDAGVDLSKPAPVQEVVKQLEGLIDEIGSILN